MKEHVKKKWVEALRSGKYKQGKGQLRDNDKFCCLGVLCDLHRKTKKKAKVKWKKNSNAIFSYDGDSKGLPLTVRKWAGIYDGNRYVIVKGTKLSHENDRGKSFEEIADIIEENL